MRRVMFAAAVALLVVAVAMPTLAASRGSRFVPMGEEPLTSTPASQGTAISPDGQVALVCLGFLGCGAATWSEGAEGQYGTSYTVIEGLVAGLPKISADYDVLGAAGSIYPTAGIWDGVPFPEAGFDPIIPLADGFAPCGTSGQSSYAMSSDGRFATGLTWVDRDNDGSTCDPGSASAFLWDRAAGTTTVLDNSVNNHSTRGNGINADGSVVVGWGQTNTREAMKWVNGVQSFICPDPASQGGDNFCTEGWDVSDDGQYILTSHAGPGDFIASAAIVDPAGTITKMDLPPFPGDPFNDAWRPRAIRADGGAVVGSYGGSGGFFGSPPYPVLWQPELGTIDLHVMLIGQGLDDLFFWYLSSAADISDDGTRIVGSGTNPNGWVEAYMIDIEKVKVCHKPDGNARTIAIAWDSVGDHLAHGDELATCEFIEAGGNSRAADELLRGVRTAGDPAGHEGLMSPQEIERLQEVGANSYAGAAASSWMTTEAGQLSEEERERRTRELAERVRSGALRGR